jgi:cytochrome P450
MLGELPRRAFSPDPLTQNDFTSDNEENRKWKHAATTVRAVVTKMVSSRLRDMEAGAAIPDDLLAQMIDAYRAEYKCGDATGEVRGGIELKAEDLVADLGDNLVEILFAGYNTVVNVIANALYFVAMNPEWFAKLQAEIDCVCGDRLPTFKDVEKVRTHRIGVCTIFTTSL